MIHFFHLHTTMIFFFSFILSLCTTIRPKNRVLINLLFLFVHDHSTKLGVTLTLLFILFLDVPIFRLLYSWQILPLHFIRYVHSSTTYIFLSVHYVHWSAVLIFRTLYPWLYEVLAECSCVSESRNQLRYTFVLRAGAHQRWVSWKLQLPSHKNKPRFNRDKPCKLISNLWDLSEYNRGN